MSLGGVSNGTFAAQDGSRSANVSRFASPHFI
jgi:hypothetical protein